MTLQDFLAILSALLAIAGVVFALGKQAQRLGTLEEDLNRLGAKVDKVLSKLEALASRFDRRLDDQAKFSVRVDQRVANLERQIYGDTITEILRSGGNFRPSSGDEDDTEIL